MRNVKSQLQPNRAFWRLDLATGTSCEFESRANCLARLEVLSCSATVGMTLQLPLHVSLVCHSGNLPVARSSHEALLEYTLLELSSHSLTRTLYNSHLNTEYLIAKLQSNLTRNKANT